MYFSAQSK